MKRAVWKERPFPGLRVFLFLAGEQVYPGAGFLPEDVIVVHSGYLELVLNNREPFILAEGSSLSQSRINTKILSVTALTECEVLACPSEFWRHGHGEHLLALDKAQLDRIPVLTYRVVSNNRIHIVWAAVPEATGYQILKRDETTFNWRHCDVVYKKTNFWDTFSAGESRIDYTIRAFNQEKLGVCSRVLTVALSDH